MNNSHLISLAYQAMKEPIFRYDFFPPSPYYRFLKILAANIHPNLSVELGVCGGGGSFHLCKGYEQGQVVGVDVAMEYPQNISFIKANCPNFKFVRGDSVTSARQIYNQLGQVDILFIDTIHTYARTILEFETWLPFMNSKQWFICLDDLFRPGMDDAWQYLQQYGNAVRIDMLHDKCEDGGGFGIIWKQQ